jgi:pseudouridine-5'-phosphate glycosidase
MIAGACSAEVDRAKRAGQPIVALESTLLTHGLPRPRNRQVALELEEMVRAAGATPATIAVLDGVPRVGLESKELERVVTEDLRKISQRDLAMAAAGNRSGGTTVAATAFLAAQAGIRVFATGGLGGVHRGWTDNWDESADLHTLSRTKITIVSAGVKSILDIPATVQRLETLNVAVVGYQTATFPAFYLSSSGIPLDWTVDSPDDVVAIMDAQDRLGLPPTALVVANPVPAHAELDPALHDEVLTDALSAAKRDQISGQSLTPYLLQYMLDATHGASLEANLAAVRANVKLATSVAVAWAGSRGGRS